jgi:RNA polymerase sigma factor (sigma-70 family)
MSDLDLLRQYAREHSQAAFTSLVDRHVNLVYSAALRQVRSPQLAEEVAQSVFIELSRHALKIPPAQPLAAWLYVVTRHTAIDAVRRESRRLTRETAAAEIAAMKTPPHAWSLVERSLDDALETLSATARAALVLRFFENQSLREVGQSLGVSEDTAQKRVSRALDRLRAFLARRGVAVGASALASDLSVHAVQAAPAGFATMLSSTIAWPGGATAKAAALHSAKKLAMTAPQKILIAATAALIVAGVFQAVTLRRQQGQIAQLENLSAGWRREIQRLDRQRALAAERLARAAEMRAGANTTDDPGWDARMRALVENVNRLKKSLDQHPHEQIPELRFLHDLDWFEVAQKFPDPGASTDDRAALAYLRIMAKHKFLPLMETALKEYLKDSQGFLPTEVTQLAPYFRPPVEDALLQRYEMLATGPAGALSRNATILREKASLAIDPAHDNLGGLTGNGDTMSGVPSAAGQSPTPEAIALQQSVDHALSAFEKAHGGNEPDPDPGEIEKLLPYFKNPDDGAKFIQGFKEAMAQSLMMSSDLNQALNEAQKAFRITHHGAESTDPLELASYFQKPEDGAKYIEFLTRHSARK